ncbi:MAG: BrnA antitoxin family protein [Hyphomicrobiales bacterium]|nr:BrnA antitoxin family protein [Hyphomicrobiales bacterium]
MSGKSARVVKYVRTELSDEQKDRLEKLASLPDDSIDYSDIPEATEQFWRNAVRNPFYRPLKKQLTLRIDADLIEWFKSHADKGKGYQTKINQALREYVAEQEKKAG